MYRVNSKPNGSIDSFKDCLVAKGFNQSYDIDYDKTYSPVAKMGSICPFLSIAGAKNIEIV